MSLKISDLCVVQFRSKCLTPEIRAWWEKTSIPYAESCARQVWWGSQKDFEDFPDDSQFNIPKLKTSEGYQFLIRLVLGLDSKIVGEDVIKGQFREGFAQFCEANPEKGRQYESVVQKIQADSRLVKSEVLSHLLRDRKETVARDLSGFQNGEEVLLISSINRHGALSDITDRLARIIGSKDKRGNPRCPKIHIISPDPKVTEKIEKGLIQLKKDHRQFSVPEIGAIEDIPELIETYPRVFVDLPMGEYPNVDEYIIEAWKGRLKRSHQMVHVRGCPQERGGSNEMWRDNQLDGFSSTEDINAEVQRRQSTNEALKGRALSMIVECAKLRVNDIQPSKAKLGKSSRMPEVA